MSIRNHFIVRNIHARPRLAVSALIGIAVAIFLPTSLALHQVTRLIIGWNAGACLYIVLAGIMMVRSTREKMQGRARAQDDGQIVILIIVIFAAVASLSAIIAELAVAKDLKGTLRYAHVALAVITILSSWTFTHMMFAMHYAHDYYIAISEKQAGGLVFPSENNPEYGDFLYFSFIIGTSGQTADVSFSSKPMRRIGLIHCVLAFLFNTTVLALTINIAASLF